MPSIDLHSTRLQQAPRGTPSADEIRLTWLSWRPESAREQQILTVAELSECRCPELCDRDHPNE